MYTKYIRNVYEIIRKIYEIIRNLYEYIRNVYQINHKVGLRKMPYNFINRGVIN